MYIGGLRYLDVEMERHPETFFIGIRIEPFFNRNPIPDLMKFQIIEFPAVRRTQPSTKKAEISSTTHVQLLQWLNGKQQ